ncbi:dihydroxy-acid dehydratase [Yoonia sp. 208BN28-4]|uniref:dihydroxy-acid dehydratase n=1 Tax=Yoonia sp. 208BN28-4 TaxID=3126505 RepID=UPI00309B9D1A
MRLTFLAALSSMALSGCAGSGFSFPGFTSAPLPVLQLLGGDVIVTGPDGYCVSPAASNARAGFAVMAGCDLIAGGPERPSVNAVITVQAGAADTAAVAGNEATFAAFLETDAGQAVLSRAGDAATVDVKSATSRDGRVSVTFADTAPDTIAGFQPTQWRGFVDVNGRLVTVTVRGLAGAPLFDGAGNALLGQALGAIRAANDASAVVVVADDAG